MTEHHMKVGKVPQIPDETSHEFLYSSTHYQMTQNQMNVGTVPQITE
jgi:hypothetical protein